MYLAIQHRLRRVKRPGFLAVKGKTLYRGSKHSTGDTMNSHAIRKTDPDGDTGVAVESERIFLRVHSSREDRIGRAGSTRLTDFDIARELHDNVSQQLTAVSMLLDRLGRKFAGDRLSHADEVLRIEAHLLNVTRDVRNLSHRVKSSGVTAAGFNRAVRELAEDVRRSAGLHTILMLAETPLPDDATAEHLYRIVQEAAHNVVKHAGASRLRVIFKVEDSSFVLVVRDDGNGISAGVGARRGRGLEAMASRARSIGAHLEVRSIPGRGTAVRCVVPF